MARVLAPCARLARLAEQGMADSRPINSHVSRCLHAHFTRIKALQYLLLKDDGRQMLWTTGYNAELNENQRKTRKLVPNHDTHHARNARHLQCCVKLEYLLARAAMHLFIYLSTTFSMYLAHIQVPKCSNNIKWCTILTY